MRAPFHKIPSFLTLSRPMETTDITSLALLTWFPLIPIWGTPREGRALIYVGLKALQRGNMKAADQICPSCSAQDCPGWWGWGGPALPISPFSPPGTTCSVQPGSTLTCPLHWCLYRTHLKTSGLQSSPIEQGVLSQEWQGRARCLLVRVIQTGRKLGG